HSNIQMSADLIAEKLEREMISEACEFVSGKNTIGVLLSGGMDSRIVAGLLRELQLKGQYAGQVVAVTWGVENSRDVVYAAEIARKFNWEFVHFPLTPELLLENIDLAADMGAEFSPVHLHAMKLVAQLKNIDGILAGSYGDSIGRGEYSGQRVHQLPDILSSHMNHFSLIRKDIETDALTQIKLDLQCSREKFPERSEISYREIERQMHYMRRQLNTCMSVIDNKIPLYQMFTKPEVFGFMWQLSSMSRNDDVYTHMLKNLPGNLLEIPWARTGKRYGQGDSKADGYLKSNNLYGRWLRCDCKNYILARLSSGRLQGLNIFNERSLEYWMKHWGKLGGGQADRLDEKMAWMASLSIFIEKYNIKSAEAESRYSLRDFFSERRAFMHTWIYQNARRVIKKSVKE